MGGDYEDAFDGDMDDDINDDGEGADGMVALFSDANVDKSK